MVAMNQVKPHLKINSFILNSKKWLENPGHDSLVSERSLRKLRPLGDFCLNGLRVSWLLFDFGIHVHEHWHCIDIDP